MTAQPATAHRIFTGTMPDGSQVLVQLWDEPGDPERKSQQ